MKRLLAGALFALLLLAGLGFGAWRLGYLRFGPPVATEVSPEAAAQAEAKYRELVEHGRPVRLNEVELTSALRYRLRDRLPGDLFDPTVALRGDTVTLSGRVPADRLPPVPALDRVRAFLPDTASIDVTGALVGGAGSVYFDVREVRFAGVPIPARYYPQALRGLGRRDQPGLPPTALGFRLPDGVAAARVAGGELILEPGTR